MNVNVNLFICSLYYSTLLWLLIAVFVYPFFVIFQWPWYICFSIQYVYLNRIYKSNRRYWDFFKFRWDYTVYAVYYGDIWIVQKSIQNFDSRTKKASQCPVFLDTKMNKAVHVPLFMCHKVGMQFIFTSEWMFSTPVKNLNKKILCVVCHWSNTIHLFLLKKVVYFWKDKIRIYSIGILSQGKWE